MTKFHTTPTEKNGTSTLPDCQRCTTHTAGAEPGEKSPAFGRAVFSTTSFIVTGVSSGTRLCLWAAPVSATAGLSTTALSHPIRAKIRPIGPQRAAFAREDTSVVGRPGLRVSPLRRCAPPVEMTHLWWDRDDTFWVGRPQMRVSPPLTPVEKARKHRLRARSEPATKITLSGPSASCVRQ